MGTLDGEALAELLSASPTTVNSDKMTAVVVTEQHQLQTPGTAQLDDPTPPSIHQLDVAKTFSCTIPQVNNAAMTTKALPRVISPSRLILSESQISVIA